MAQPVTAAELRQKQAPPGKVDPDVSIPRAVREAALRAETIQKAVIGEAEPAVIVPPNGQEPPPPPPTNGAEPPPVNVAPAEPPPPPAPPTPPAPQTPVDWERQFHSLNGRFEKFQKDQKDAMGILSEHAAKLERELAAARNAPPQSPTPPAPQNLLTEQEIADYGPEFIDVINRVVQGATAPLHSEITTLRSQLGHVANETTNAFLTRMNSTLDGLVPGWAQLNKHEDFIRWSQLPDIFSGGIRKELMQDAWNSGDANRVAAFFRAYHAEVAATNPQGSGAPQRTLPRTVVTPTLVPPQALAPASPLHPQAPPVSLDDLAAPGRAHSAGGAPAEKPVYTAEEITRFYADVAAGRWRGRDADRIAIDADIMLAGREGRIIPNARTTVPAPPHGFTR